MWVAPSCVAASSFSASMSTAMIVAGAGQRRAGDRGDADAAAADDGDGLAAGDVAGVDGGAEAGHHAAAEQADGGGPAPTGRPWCTGRRRRGSSRRRRRCPAPGTARCRPSASVIFWVALWVAKQYCGSPRLQARQSPQTARQLRITKSPGATLGDVVADRLDDAGGLVAEQEREVVVDAALAVVQVGVADPARLDLHHGLARTRVRDVDRDDLDRARPWRVRRRP